MKKAIYCALIVSFIVAGFGAVANAAVPTATIKGSFLAFPKVVVSATEDTLITLYNDQGSNGTVDITCYYVDEEQNTFDVHFDMTKNHTVWFWASTGTGMLSTKPRQVAGFGNNIGELLCWAVGDDKLPLTWNHLTGTATLFDFAVPTALGYNAYAFRKLAAGDGDAVLDLDNQEYDACPKYVIGTMPLNGAKFEDAGRGIVEATTTDLTLIPCIQDVSTEDRTPTYAKVDFDIFNEDESLYTGAYICYKCWMESTLGSDPVKSKGVFKFNNAQLFDFVGPYQGVNPYNTFLTFRAYGKATTNATTCNFPGGALAVQTPVIGTLFTTYTLSAPATPGVVTIGETLQSTNTPSTAANSNIPIVSGAIKYLRGSGTSEMNAR